MMGCKGKIAADSPLAVDWVCDLHWNGELYKDGRKIWRCSRDLCANFIYVDAAVESRRIRKWRVACQQPRLFAAGSLVEWLAHKVKWWVYLALSLALLVVSASGMMQNRFMFLSTQLFNLSVFSLIVSIILFVKRDQIAQNSCRACSVRKIILNLKCSLACPTSWYNLLTRFRMVQPSKHVSTRQRIIAESSPTSI